MESFCKREECPTSDALLALAESDSWAYIDEIESHLLDCEFCAAELEFYRLYSPVKEEALIEEMPRPLRELAHALLQKKTDLTPLYRLIRAD